MAEGNPPLLDSTIHDPMSSYMNCLPTAWVIPHPDVQLIKRGNAYYAKPQPTKPADPPPVRRSKAPKSTKKPS
jgi:hypothetical protein